MLIFDCMVMRELEIEVNMLDGRIEETKTIMTLD